MHALLNNDARSPKIMMNAEGKVPKKGFAYSHMWKVSIVAACRKHLHTHSVCKFSLDCTQCVRMLSKRRHDADFPLPQIDGVE